MLDFVAGFRGVRKTSGNHIELVNSDSVGYRLICMLFAYLCFLEPGRYTAPTVPKVAASGCVDISEDSKLM